MNTPTASSDPAATIAFIGGGNMASALLAGLLKGGTTAASVLVVEPFAEQAARLQDQFGVTVLPSAGPALAGAAMVVWAVKPQLFGEAAAPCAEHVGGALHLSVMAGIRSETIAKKTGSRRIVRAMPNTPALIGRGVAGLYASDEVSPDERRRVEALLAPTGSTLWVDREADLDAVTALSGSGPAYVFYFLEAMVQAGTEMGLSPEQARALAVGTFAGATEQVAQSSDALELLRQRVTSKGGTTFAAISALDDQQVKPAFVRALQAARLRATELGDEFGAA